MFTRKMNLQLVAILIALCALLGYLGDGTFAHVQSVEKATQAVQLPVSEITIVANKLCGGNYLINSGEIQCVSSVK